MEKIVICCFIFLFVAAQISAQNCTLKSADEKCLRDVECCSSCCRGDVCSDAGSCFPVCNSTSNLEREGPAICGLVTTLNSLAGILDNITEEFFMIGIPILHRAESFFQLISSNPLMAFSEIQHLNGSIQDLFSLGDTLQKNLPLFLQLGTQIFNYFIQLFSALTSDQF